MNEHTLDEEKEPTPGEITRMIPCLTVGALLDLVRDGLIGMDYALGVRVQLGAEAPTFVVFMATFKNVRFVWFDEQGEEHRTRLVEKEKEEK